MVIPVVVRQQSFYKVLLDYNLKEKIVIHYISHKGLVGPPVLSGLSSLGLVNKKYICSYKIKTILLTSILCPNFPYVME